MIFFVTKEDFDRKAVCKNCSYETVGGKLITNCMFDEYTCPRCNDLDIEWVAKKDTHPYDCECYFCFYKDDPVNGKPLSASVKPIFCSCGPSGHNLDCEIGYRNHLIMLNYNHDEIIEMVDYFRKMKGKIEEHF